MHQYSFKTFGFLRLTPGNMRALKHYAYGIFKGQFTRAVVVMTLLLLPLYYVTHGQCGTLVQYVYRPVNSTTPYRLPRAQLVTYKQRYGLNQTKYSAFSANISASEHGQFMKLLDVFVTLCDYNGLMYMLYGGSLIGAYRHFGMIPWDDDIDILMNVTEKSRIQRLLSNITGHTLYIPEYNTGPNNQWKLFKTPTPEHHTTLLKDHWHWPFLDIFFFKENDTHIWDENIDNELSAWYNNQRLSYRKRLVFPLNRRHFELFSMPVPRCTQQCLEQLYDVNICVSAQYSHMHEKAIMGRQAQVPCKLLHPFTVFVFRTTVGGFMNEVLKLSDQVLAASSRSLIEVNECAIIQLQNSVMNQE